MGFAVVAKPGIPASKARTAMFFLAGLCGLCDPGDAVGAVEMPPFLVQGRFEKHMNREAEDGEIRLYYRAAGTFAFSSSNDWWRAETTLKYDPEHSPPKLAAQAATIRNSMTVPGGVRTFKVFEKSAGR